MSHSWGSFNYPSSLPALRLTRASETVVPDSSVCQRESLLFKKKTSYLRFALCWDLVQLY